MDKVKDDIKDKGLSADDVYALMMCTPVLHGGICHRTSTPHKSGNKMKEKKTDNFAGQNSMELREKERMSDLLSLYNIKHIHPVFVSETIVHKSAVISNVAK